MQSELLASKARERAVRRSIEIYGKQFTYFEYPSSLEKAETIVMIHGYRGNHHGLEAIAAGLDRFQVLIPDLPGFGESPELEATHSLDSYSEWLKVFLESLGLSGSCHLVGHSFGSLVVGLYATKNQCKSITLINPVSAPALSGPRALLTQLTSIFYYFSKSLPEKLGGLVLRSPLAVMVMSSVMAKTKNRVLRKWIHQQHLSNFSDFSSVKVASEGYDASISSNLSQMAPSIASPVLIIAATLDDITDIATQGEVAKMYPNASIVEIERVGHLVHYEAPAEAANYISHFVESLA